VATGDGSTWATQWLVTAIGALSVPTLPSIGHVRARGAGRIEASVPAAGEWTAHTYETVDRLLLSKVDSWFHGVNSNLPGKRRRPLIYAGGLPRYRERCEEVAAAGYEGFLIS
jgi:hypothetical protein